ncbi:MAG: alanine racemase, partial [Acidobacteria bacterium]|nr:alanine racemase [Acidobacteriota bacterium]
MPYIRPEIVPHTPDIGNRFGRSAEDRVISEIDGVPIDHLVNQYGSPLFVFSERLLRERIRRFRRAFTARYPRVRFAWSYKTNYLDAVCAIFHQEGWHAEVVSELEYEMARRLGVAGAQIICNGAHKPLSWCERAVAEGALIQIDHFDEIETLEQATAQREEPIDVGLRINMSVASLGVMWERFGFNLENGEALEAASQVIDSAKLRLSGVHCHLGTFITLPEAYREATRKLARFAQD